MLSVWTKAAKYSNPHKEVVMPSKQELESRNLLELGALCLEVAEIPSASSVEADQARELERETGLLKHVESPNNPHPMLSEKTIIQAKKESLKRRMVDFLMATWPLRKTKSAGK
jgi:cysteine synthase